jgi:hypothetical protein
MASTARLIRGNAKFEMKLTVCVPFLSHEGHEEHDGTKENQKIFISSLPSSLRGKRE